MSGDFYKEWRTYAEIEAPHLAHVYELRVQAEAANPHGYWVFGRFGDLLKDSQSFADHDSPGLHEWPLSASEPTM